MMSGLPRLANVAQLVRARTDEERSVVVSEDPVVGPALRELDELWERATNPRASRYAEAINAEIQFNLMDLVREGEAGKEVGRAEGRREERIRSILRVLEARGIDMAPQDRESLGACHDMETLRGWLVRASTMNVGDVLFAE